MQKQQQHQDDNKKFVDRLLELKKFVQQKNEGEQNPDLQHIFQELDAIYKEASNKEKQQH
jgi:hypothetical protein